MIIYDISINGTFITAGFSESSRITLYNDRVLNRKFKSTLKLIKLCIRNGRRRGWLSGEWRCKKKKPVQRKIRKVKERQLGDRPLHSVDIWSQTIALNTVNPVINYTNADSRYVDRDFPPFKCGWKRFSCGLGGNNNANSGGYWWMLRRGVMSRVLRVCGGKVGGNESRICAVRYEYTFICIYVSVCLHGGWRTAGGM